MQSAWWIHCYQSTSQRELNAGWINGGSGPNSFQKAASFQLLLLLMFIPRSPFCLLSCILCLPSSPQGLDKYSFYLFPFSDEDPPPISLSEVFRAFLFLCFPSIYLSLVISQLLPSSLSLSFATYLFSLSHSVITNHLSSQFLLLSTASSPFVCLPRWSPSPISLLFLFFFFFPASVPLFLAGCLESSRVCSMSRWGLSCRRRQLLSPST